MIGGGRGRVENAAPRRIRRLSPHADDDSHRLDLVMIWPPGIDNGAIVVTPDSVWYARVSLLFSAAAQSKPIPGPKLLQII